VLCDDVIGLLLFLSLGCFVELFHILSTHHETMHSNSSRNLLLWLRQFQVWQNDGPNKFVNQTSTQCGRVVQPNEKSNLDEKVEWNPLNQKLSALFKDGNESKDNPVCQPLGIGTGTV
jgi:hypothetical protein